MPPRKRRPDLDILPDVEAVCLKAMEKDRDKRFADMDALYRALGAAGGLPFEPSSRVHARRPPSLKYPTLAERQPAGARVEDGAARCRRGARSRTSGPCAPRQAPAGRRGRASSWSWASRGRWRASRCASILGAARRQPQPRRRPRRGGRRGAGRRRRRGRGAAARGAHRRPPRRAATARGPDAPRGRRPRSPDRRPQGASRASGDRSRDESRRAEGRSAASRDPHPRRDRRPGRAEESVRRPLPERPCAGFPVEVSAGGGGGARGRAGARSAQRSC